MGERKAKINRPTVGSLFTGIGGFDLGLERAGWRVAWQVENNPFRKKILRRHWPHVELRDDIATDTDGLPPVDLICGGFPCQDLSVAGRRAGLAGERSALFFEFARLLGTLRPRWCLIENVPGLLSSNGGRDFGVVLDTLGKLGYWWTYRVLDSQYFGVAQRRRRVYVVGHLGSPCPAEILFDPESLRRDTPPSQETGSEVAGTIGAQLAKRSHAPDGNGAYIANTLEATHALRWDNSKDNLIPTLSQTLHTSSQKYNDGSLDTYVVNARQDPITGLPSLDTDGHSHAVLGAPPDADGVRAAAGLPRRLDDTPDTPRYAALGDAVTVSVAEWIARRILEAHDE